MSCQKNVLARITLAHCKFNIRSCNKYYFYICPCVPAIYPGILDKIGHTMLSVLTCHVGFSLFPMAMMWLPFDISVDISKALLLGGSNSGVVLWDWQLGLMILLLKIAWCNRNFHYINFTFCTSCPWNSHPFSWFLAKNVLQKSKSNVHFHLLSSWPLFF